MNHDTLNKSNLITRYIQILTIQEYGKNSTIDGVRFIPLTYNKDDTGEFVELGRLTNGRLESTPDFVIKQVSTSVLLPDAVKAFHLHFNQSDAWFVSPHDRALVGLLDTRKNSKTANTTMRFILGAGTANLVVIPAGVAHGIANPWDRPVTLTYFTNRQFNPGAPDERRLPYDLFGKEFWELTKG